MRKLVLVMALLLLFGAVQVSAQGGEDLDILEILAAASEGEWLVEQTGDNEWTVVNDDGTVEIIVHVVIEDSEPTQTVDPNFEIYFVVPTSNMNVRACGSTSCDVVGSVTATDVIEVLEETDDDQGRGQWLRFELDGGEAWVAGWLTRPGPDIRLSQSEIEDGYLDERTNCIVLLNVVRGSSNMAFVITGEARGDVFVDLYRPNENQPLRVDGTYHKTFIDTGDPYLHQVYGWRVGFPSGIYTIDLTGPDGENSIIEFEYTRTGDSSIFVVCD